MSEWISVKDRAPLLHERVLISDGKHIGHARRLGGGYSIVASNDPVPNHKVTHWMPLPEPPKGAL